MKTQHAAENNIPSKFHATVQHHNKMARIEWQTHTHIRSFIHTPHRESVNKTFSISFTTRHAIQTLAVPFCLQIATKAVYPKTANVCVFVSLAGSLSLCELCDMKSFSTLNEFYCQSAKIFVCLVNLRVSLLIIVGG